MCLDVRRRTTSTKPISRAVLVGMGSMAASPLTRLFHWHALDADEEHAVCVAGDFYDWDKIPMTPTLDGDYRATEDFKPALRGVYMYKYEIDGRWQHDPNALTCLDEHGHVNNVVEVLGPARHEHDTFKRCDHVSDGYPDATESTIVICDGCQQENLAAYHHCTVCDRFDYCAACFETRDANRLDPHPAELAAWVASTRALAYLEHYTPMLRAKLSGMLTHQHMAFAKSLKALLQRNGHLATVFDDAKLQSEEAVFDALMTCADKLRERL